MGIGAWGGTCPFRGQLPIRVTIDERCPAAVPCYVIPVDMSTSRERAAVESQPIPILREDSYCSTCTSELVREIELGLVVKRRSGSGPSIGGPGRLVRRRRPAGGAKAQIERLAAKLAAP